MKFLDLIKFFTVSTNVGQFVIFAYVIILVIYPVASTIFFGVFFPATVVPVVPVDSVILSEILSGENSTLITESKTSTEESSFGGPNKTLAIVLFCLMPALALLCAFL